MPEEYRFHLAIGSRFENIELVQVGDQAYADRYTYVPLIGLFVAIVWAAADLATHLRWPVAAARAAGKAFLLACSGVFRNTRLTFVSYSSLNFFSVGAIVAQAGD